MQGTSKCHQCCNTEHNCNFTWQPTTEADWAAAYVWRYDASTYANGNFGTALEQNPRTNDPVITG